MIKILILTTESINYHFSFGISPLSKSNYLLVSPLFTPFIYAPFTLHGFLSKFYFDKKFLPVVTGKTCNFSLDNRVMRYDSTKIQIT